VSMSRIFMAPTAETEPAQSVADKVGRLFDAAGFETLIDPKDLFAIKLHFGECKERSHVPPEVARTVADRIRHAGGKPFLTETSTLYVGDRSNAVDHLTLAYERGFTFDAIGAPIIMADGLLGESQVEVEINQKHCRTIAVATGARAARGFLVISHATGHIAAGMGAAIKNVAMGLSSRAGKFAQHSEMKPEPDREKCIACGICVEWCPADAIEINDKANVNHTKCVGCGQCYAVCPHNAMKHDWGAGSQKLQEVMCEAALAVMKGREKKFGFINILKHISKRCDCEDIHDEPVIPDICILASRDPVAIDTLTMDLMMRIGGNDLFKKWWPGREPRFQLEYGEAIGLGNRQYKIEVVE